MKKKDYEKYKKDGTRSSKSQLKELINIYIDINNKIKNESSFKLKSLKENIKKTYQEEIYFTIIDEKSQIIKFNITEKSKKYFIPVFTDINEFKLGFKKISKLFLDSLTLKVISPLDIVEISKKDENFQGIIINPHNQNFSFDIESLKIKK